MQSKSYLYILIIFITTVCLNKLAFAEISLTRDSIILFMAGDVMTGRGIDQVLPYPGDPRLYEPYVKDARDYVEMAEVVNGSIQKPVQCHYIWGDALEVLEQVAPDVRLINLETSITSSNEYWPGKRVHYKMHPKNVSCLKEARIDFCSLANNHVLDWSYPGLTETLDSLKDVNIKISGAGENLQEAEQPVTISVEGKGRVIVLSYGLSSSGIPSSWAAKKDRPGVNLLRSLSGETVQHVKEQIDKIKQAGDIVIASIHWGSNWGYAVPQGHIDFAHQLIDDAGVDIIHGHSSHHARPLEVYKGKLIIYGSGDFITDYEGISGHDEYRDDLVLMYFAHIDPNSGKLIQLQMIPLQIKKFRLNRASEKDIVWLKNTFNREGKVLGTQIQLSEDNVLTIY
jgi:poly-gamma-glutamate synthesis protein (capsule biosynthesis protein)